MLNSSWRLRMLLACPCPKSRPVRNSTTRVFVAARLASANQAMRPVTPWISMLPVIRLSASRHQQHYRRLKRLSSKQPPASMDLHRSRRTTSPRGRAKTRAITVIPVLGRAVSLRKRPTARSAASTSQRRSRRGRSSAKPCWRQRKTTGDLPRSRLFRRRRLGHRCLRRRNQRIRRRGHRFSQWWPVDRHHLSSYPILSARPPKADSRYCMIGLGSGQLTRGR